MRKATMSLAVFAVLGASIAVYLYFTNNNAFGRSYFN